MEFTGDNLMLFYLVLGLLLVGVGLILNFVRIESDHDRKTRHAARRHK